MTIQQLIERLKQEPLDAEVKFIAHPNVNTFEEWGVESIEPAVRRNCVEITIVY